MNARIFLLQAFGIIIIAIPNIWSKIDQQTFYNSDTDLDRIVTTKSPELTERTKYLPAILHYTNVNGKLTAERWTTNIPFR